MLTMRPVLAAAVLASLAGVSSCRTRTQPTGTCPEPRDGSRAGAPAPAAAELTADTSVEPELLAALRKAQVGDHDDYIGLILTWQISLARLGYMLAPFNGELDARTLNAFTQYRRTHGLPGQYALDKVVLERLGKDAEVLGDHDVPVIHDRAFQDSGFMLLVSGSWKLLNGTEVFPYQFSRIECIGEERGDLPHCLEAMSYLSSNVLGAEVAEYKVSKWTKTEIVANEDEFCRRTQLRLNRVTQQAMKVRTTTKTDGYCANISKVDAQYQLVDGDEVAQGRSDAQLRELRRVLRIPDELFKETAKDPPK